MMLGYLWFFYMKIKYEIHQTWYDSGSYRVVAYSMIFWDSLSSHNSVGAPLLPRSMLLIVWDKPIGLSMIPITESLMNLI